MDAHLNVDLAPVAVDDDVTRTDTQIGALTALWTVHDCLWPDAISVARLSHSHAIGSQAFGFGRSHAPRWQQL